jgi:hypothetical protein
VGHQGGSSNANEVTGIQLNRYDEERVVVYDVNMYLSDDQIKNRVV